MSEWLKRNNMESLANESFSFLFLFVQYHLSQDGQWTPEGRKIGTMQATGSTLKGQRQILFPPIFLLCLEWHCHLQELNGRLVDTSKLGKTGERQINTVKELEKIRERVRALCVLVSQAQAVWRNNSPETLNCKDCELQMHVSLWFRPASRLSSSRSPWCVTHSDKAHKWHVQERQRKEDKAAKKEKRETERDWQIAKQTMNVSTIHQKK